MTHSIWTAACIEREYFCAKKRQILYQCFSQYVLVGRVKNPLKQDHEKQKLKPAWLHFLRGSLENITDICYLIKGRYCRNRLICWLCDPVSDFYWYAWRIEEVWCCYTSLQLSSLGQRLRWALRLSGRLSVWLSNDTASLIYLLQSLLLMRADTQTWRCRKASSSSSEFP